MFARRSLHASEGQRSSSPRLWKGKSFPASENRKDSGTKSPFVAPGGKEAFGISLWDQAGTRKATTESLRRSGEGLGEVIDGAPQVETYEVANSTFHKIAAAAAA